MLPVKKIFLFAIFLLILPFFFSVKKVRAEASCSVRPIEKNNGLIVTGGNFDVKADGFAGIDAPYTVEFFYPGSEREDEGWVTPFCINWTYGPYLGSPKSCSAPAIYNTNGCYAVEVRVTNYSGSQPCGYTNVDVCNSSSGPVIVRPLSVTAIRPSDSDQKSISDFICGAEFTNKKQSWVGLITGQVSGRLSILPTSEVITSDQVSLAKNGYVSYMNGSYGEAHGRLNFRKYGITNSKSITFNLTGSFLPGNSGSLSTTVGLWELNDSINIFHRTANTVCPVGPQGCNPQVVCNEISHRKAGETEFTTGNISSVMPGTSVELMCTDVQGSADGSPAWNWAAWLPESKVSSFYYNLPDNHYLGETYTVSSGNQERWEPFVLGNPPRGTSWLVDKLVAKINWLAYPAGKSFSVFGNIANNDGTIISPDKYNHLEFNGSDNGRVVTFDFGYNDLVETSILPNTTYKAVLRAARTETGNLFPSVAWFNNYASGGRMNYYEIWARPNVQGSFIPGSRNSTFVTWIAPSSDQVASGDTFDITTHGNSLACGWGSGGDTVTATIGNFSTVRLEYYLNSVSAGNKIRCNNPTYAGLGATIAGAGGFSCDPIDQTQWISIPVPTGTRETTPVLGSWTFNSWSLIGGAAQGGTAQPFNITFGTGITYTLRIVITEPAAPRWWQSKDGDLQAATGSVVSTIPVGASKKYISIDGDDGKTPGVVSYATVVSAGTNGGNVSSKNWQAKTNYMGATMNFTYLMNRLKIPTSTAFTGTMPSADGFYYSATAKDLTGNFPAGKKIVIFVNGDVVIKNDIVVPEGSFFALVSSGNITFDNAVSKAQGFFLADGILSDGTGAVAFAGQGSFIGWGGINMGRDLGVGNNTAPAEMFTYRPDLYVNSPTGFIFSNSFFREVAP